MTTYYSLPFEIIILISRVTPATWCSMTRADPRVGRYSLCRNTREDAQDHFTTKTINTEKGKIIYYLPNGLTHRNGDQPAIIYESYTKPYTTDQGTTINLKFGGKIWKRYGVTHRDRDQPAIVYENSDLMWYKNGKIHRDGDLPAVILNGDKKIWYKNGKIHRSGDNPAVIGGVVVIWYKNDKIHRDGDQPAYLDINSGKVIARYWYKNNRLHRDGIRSAIVSPYENIRTIQRNGILLDNTNKIDSDIPYYTLPLQVILLISTYSPVIWCGLVKADSRLTRLLCKSVLVEMQDRFTTYTTEIVDQPFGLGRGKRKIYRLPNGMIHRNGNPAVIYECGLEKWYFNGELHREWDPAIVHRGHIKKWYKNGVLFHEYGMSTIKIYKLNAASYNNEHYN
jgi:antitoxin component YwqK of YwqJK toxin-antitoxin module